MAVIVPRETICTFRNCTEEARPEQRYCHRHHALSTQQYRRRHKLTREQRLRSNARRYVNVYIERGKIKRGLCEVCDSPDTQPHHEDYTKPLQVRWFCREHHLAHEGKRMHKPSIEKY